MEDQKIVASPRTQEKARPTRQVPDEGWAALGWIGLAFLLVGGVDFALTWVPLNFGNREWEFASVTTSFNGLPILLLGIGLLIVASAQLKRRWWGVLGGVGSVALMLAVVGGALLWATNLPLALSSVPPDLAVGLKKAVTKTLLQSVVYSVVLGYLVVKAVRAVKTAAGIER